MGDIGFILEMRKCIKKGHSKRDGERFITVQVKYFHSGHTTSSSSCPSEISLSLHITKETISGITFTGFQMQPSENDMQSRKKALTSQLLFSVLPWCVHESLPIASPELYCSSLSYKSNSAWKDEFVLSQMPMSKLLSIWKNQSKTKKTSLALFILEFEIFFT